MIVFHLTTIVLTVLVVLYADEQGLLWMLGRKQVLDAKHILALHSVVSVGLAVTILTGALMAWPDIAYYVSMPIFLVKMGFVLTLVVNAFFIGAFASVAAAIPFSSLAVLKRRMLLLVGTISFVGWVGAISCGLLLSNYFL